MECRWVTERIVAFQDDELSPGETIFVAEHLDGCTDCREHEQALAAVTPEPFLEIPPEVMARMAAAVDTAIAEELERPVVLQPPTLVERSVHWLRRDRDTSNAVLLGYGLMFAACLGWGVSNWFAVQALQPDPQRPSIAHTDGGDRGDVVVPSDQYRPASWTPEDDDDEWR